MIFRIIFIVMVVSLLRISSDIRHDFEKSEKKMCQQVESKPETKLHSVHYEQIDDIIALRERAKIIEDLITSIESTQMENGYIKQIAISWSDAIGIKEYKTFSSEKLLEYLYSERDEIRTSLLKKVKKIAS